MEPIEASRLRAKLYLGKFTVVSRSETSMKIALGGSTTMTVSHPELSLFDIREGDLLTFYTEVLLAKNNIS